MEMPFPEMTEFANSKRSSVDLSTWEGEDSSSEATGEPFVPAPPAPSPEKSLHFRGRSPAAGATRAPAVQDDDEDDQDDYYYNNNDRDEMPSTREPSPEPMWNHKASHYAGEYLPQYNQVYFVPGKQVPEPKPVTMMYPTFAPHNEHPMQRLNPTTLPRDAFLMPPSMPSATHPTTASRATNVLLEPKTSSKQREPKTTSKPQEEVRSKSASKGKQGSKKSNVKTRAEAVGKGDTFSNLSDDKKQALAKYIYDLMLEKEFTSPDGYLLVDVLAEVWKDMGDGATGGRIAQHRFAELLRFAPQYFELFRKGIRVTNHCGWFARKGEKMVRLIPQTSM
jgi:hypothetical protein